MYTIHTDTKVFQIKEKGRAMLTAAKILDASLTDVKKLIECNSDTSPLMQEYARIIYPSVDTLVELVKEFGEAAALHTDLIRLEYSHFNLLTLLTKCVDALYPFAQAKQISVDMNSDREVIYVAADYERTYQILSYVLLHYISIGQPKNDIGITVQVNDEWVMVSIVTDQHYGTDPLPEHVDSEQYRLLELSKRKNLRLALVREFVKLHGGIIRFSFDDNTSDHSVTISLPIHLLVDDTHLCTENYIG